MADFTNNQKMFEQLMNQAEEERLKKDQAEDQLKQAQQHATFATAFAPTPSAAQILTHQQPVDRTQQIQQAYIAPAAQAQQAASTNYKDILGQYNMLKNQEIQNRLANKTDMGTGMVSQFKQAKQDKLIPEDMSFTAFVKSQHVDNSGDKLSKQTDKWQENLEKDLDADKSRTGNFAIPSKMKMASQRIIGLFNQFPDGNIPKSQSVELASAVAGVVSGGISPQSQQQINELVPSSMRGRAEDIAALVTNEPRGRQQQKFMELLKGTAKREAEIADQQMEEIRVKRLPFHKKFRESDPETFNQIVSAYGLNPEYIGKDMKYNKPKTEPVNIPSEQPQPSIVNSGFNVINNAQAAPTKKSREQMIADIKAKMGGK